MSKELKWGQTPWDNLSRKELLCEVQRMYAAITSLNSCLSILRRGETDGFWSLPNATDRGGSGGRALEEARLILEPLHEKYSSENIYRAFFRYAVDLLFTPRLGACWTACDGCPHLYGDSQGDMIGKPCPDCAREGRQSIRRALEWRDLSPR